MSDSILTDKISETITNVFKKTIVFDKLGKIQFLFGTFVIISSFVGITNIYLNYITSNKITKFLEDQEDKISGIIQVNNDNCINKLENKINELENKLSQLLDSQNKTLDDISFSIKTDKNNKINVSTSMSSFSQIINVENNNITKIEYNESSISHDNTIDKEDNELLNEYYDYMPMNNLKKNIGFSWFSK